MLDWLLGRRRPEPAAPPGAILRYPDRPAAVPIDLRVCMVVHDPLVEAEGGARLRELLGWHDPDGLAEAYRADLLACSGGLARYSIVERHVIDGYPAKLDGFRYDDASYLGCWRRRGGWHQPDAVDYLRLLGELDLPRRVAAGAFDEVWLFGFPYAGYYESIMAGPGAIWCNAPPLEGSAGWGRRFVVMGFNYERDVGCMLENFGHRVESIMAHVYRGHPGERNLWERFTRYDQRDPGRAECGNVHFAPGSLHDYDWGRRRQVACRADAWYGYPDLSAPPRTVGPEEWGDGDMRLHHLWWLDHLPRAPGEHDGVLASWWSYVLRPELIR